MNRLARFLSVLTVLPAVCLAADKPSLRATWDMPPQCDPLAPVRIQDLKEELRQTGYRLVIAIHPAQPPGAKGEPPPRDLYIINADGTGLKQLTKHARHRRAGAADLARRHACSPTTTATTWLTPRPSRRGNSTAATSGRPTARQTAECGKNGIIYRDVQTGKKTKTVRVPRTVSIVDLSADGNWFIFEIRNYLGSPYTIDFLSAAGGEIRKLPNHPIRDGECHPAFSPDGKWMCWNSGRSLSVRKFDPSLPDGTDGKIITLPEKLLGQDPCGRWSHCGRYIAYVKIPHAGSWRVHSPICIVRLADNATLTLSPPGWLGHHWDYDWLPPE